MKIRKILNKRKMAIGLLAGVSLFIWIPNILADDDDEGTLNLIAVHDSSSRQYNDDCVSCHAEILNARSLDPSIPNAHVAMIPFAPGEEDEDTCVVCHRSVDLVQGSAGSIRKQVDATFCTMCHGPAGPGNKFYQAGLSSTLETPGVFDPGKPDYGSELYGLACAACHRDLANSEVSGESAEEIREKINEDEGGMGPLRALSTQEIQAIAAALAD